MSITSGGTNSVGITIIGCGGTCSYGITSAVHQSIGSNLGVDAFKWQSVQGASFHVCLYVIGDCIVWLRGVGCVFIVIRANPGKSHAGSFTV